MHAVVGDAIDHEALRRAARRRRFPVSLLQAVARSHAGGCLHEGRSAGANTAVRWRCARGHVWETLPGSVLEGHWCARCGGPHRNTLADMRALAAERGGACISVVYVNMSTKLEWRCAEGHVWSARPGNVKAGTWCPYCAHRVPRTVAEAKALASARGGECLSKRVPRTDRHLAWRCAEGHRWSATFSMVESGTWCPACAGNVAKSIEDMKALAEARGGQCTSKRYRGANRPLSWRCARGHRFKMTPHALAQRSFFCSRCRRDEQDAERLEALRRAARARGGDVLSRWYRGIEKRHVFRCKRGHRFETTPHSVRRGNWCLACSHLEKRGSRTYSIAAMRRLAERHGGQCLSKRFVNLETKLRWRCAEGHEWAAVPHHLVYHGSWCPRCAAARP